MSNFIGWFSIVFACIAFAVSFREYLYFNTDGGRHNKFCVIGFLIVAAICFK